MRCYTLYTRTIFRLKNWRGSCENPILFLVKNSAKKNVTKPKKSKDLGCPVAPFHSGGLPRLDASRPGFWVFLAGRLTPDQVGAGHCQDRQDIHK